MRIIVVFLLGLSVLVPSFSAQARVDSFSFFPERTKPSFVEKILNQGTRDVMVTLARYSDDTYVAYREFRRNDEQQPFHSALLRSLGNLFLGI